MKRNTIDQLTASPVITRFPYGFQRITVIGALCCELLENVDEGLILPSHSQQDTIPSAQPIAKTLPFGCQSRQVTLAL